MLSTGAGGCCAHVGGARRTAKNAQARDARCAHARQIGFKSGSDGVVIKGEWLPPPSPYRVALLCVIYPLFDRESGIEVRSRLFGMLKPAGLTHGHYECRTLDDTIPVFTDLLAMTVVKREDREAVLEHPNARWRLVVHEAGAGALDKPRNNHYGFRVANAHEIGAAWEYIEANKERYRLKRV